MRLPRRRSSDHAGDLSLQVVYVDNGSTDGSAEAARARPTPAPRSSGCPENEGLPARNHGLRRARGRNRMFIDTDATVTDGALQTMCSILDGDSGIGLVGPRLVYPDGTLQLSARRYPPVMLPVLRRPPLERFFDDARTVRRHLMADEAPLPRRRVEYVLGACQMFSAARAGRGGRDRPPDVVRPRRRGLVLQDPPRRVHGPLRPGGDGRPRLPPQLRGFAGLAHGPPASARLRPLPVEVAHAAAPTCVAEGRAMDTETLRGAGLDSAGPAADEPSSMGLAR